MVKVDIASTTLSILTQSANCNLNITLGSNVKPATINLNGSIGLTIATYNSNDMFISRNIGIGTTLPNYRMHIYSDNSTDTQYESSGILLDNQSSNITFPEMGIAFNNAITDDDIWVLGMANNDTKLSLNYGPQINQITNSNANMFITTNSLVAIGNLGDYPRQNASKFSLLSDRSRITLPYGSNIGIKFIRKVDNVITHSILPDIQTGELNFTNSDGAITKATSPLNSTGIRIQADGNVGIGNTLPTQEVEISKPSYFATSLGIGFTDVLTPLNFAVNGDSYFNGNVGIGTTIPLYCLHLTSDSAFKPTTNTWSFSSDERLKTNIYLADLDKCWQTIKNIPLKKYKWNSNIYIYTSDIYDHTKLGWLAQDVEVFLPNSIQTKNAYNLIDCKFLNADEIYANMYGALQKSIEKLHNIHQSIVYIQDIVSKQL